MLGPSEKAAKNRHAHKPEHGHPKCQKLNLGHSATRTHEGRLRPLARARQYYLPFAETLILICFGLDSSRLAICRVKTPLR